MSTADAIANLRDKLNLSQKEFAKKLQVTVTSVSRYENGREPTGEILMRLSEISEQAGLIHLKDLFAAKKRSDIAAQVEKLRSPGAARRIPVFELEGLRFAAKNSLQVLSDFALYKGNQTPAHQTVIKALLELSGFIATTADHYLDISNGGFASLNDMRTIPFQPSHVGYSYGNGYPYGGHAKDGKTSTDEK